jgi:hypothetical protein
MGHMEQALSPARKRNSRARLFHIFFRFCPQRPPLWEAFFGGSGFFMWLWATWGDLAGLVDTRR